MVHDLDSIFLYLGGASLQGRWVCGGAGGFGVEVWFMRHKINLHIFILHKTLAVFKENRARQTDFFFIISDVLRLT
ncbi:MAG: hypothetical protein Q8K65_00630 [Alphaproteobacteria bacterium]|nr:hypothetical protein [Alphaproteobacteria bacterium]